MRQLDYLVHNVDNCAMILTTETGLISMQWRLIGSNDFINDLCLQNIPLLDRLFTWSNNQDSPTLCRLDRALVNLDWSNFSQTLLSRLALELLQTMCLLSYMLPPLFLNHPFFASITTGLALLPSLLSLFKIGKVFCNMITTLLPLSVSASRGCAMLRKNGIKVVKNQASLSQTVIL